MLALIHGTYFECTPVPAPSGEVEIKYNPQTRVVSTWKGANRVDFGPMFFNRTKKSQINAQTGQITGEKAQIRVVFDGNHYDYDETA